PHQLGVLVRLLDVDGTADLAGSEAAIGATWPLAREVERVAVDLEGDEVTGGLRYRGQGEAHRRQFLLGGHCVSPNSKCSFWVTSRSLVGFLWLARSTKRGLDGGDSSLDSDELARHCRPLLPFCNAKRNHLLDVGRFRINVRRLPHWVTARSSYSAAPSTNRLNSLMSTANAGSCDRIT